ncbi:MAG: hypothetical protein LUH20_04895 [Lachnospiraceae bacterium]|nr:hypothetical protein [Lachnospiraceae bacterium]
MNWTVIIDYVPAYREAMLLTLRIGWMGIVLATVLGLAGAFIRYYHVPVLSQMVLLFLVYFGTTRMFGWNLSGELTRWRTPRAT